MIGRRRLVGSLGLGAGGVLLGGCDRIAATPAFRGFVDATYQPEPKKRKRPESFRPLTDRFGQPVRVSTDKIRGGGHPGA